MARTRKRLTLENFRGIQFAAKTNDIDLEKF